MHTQRYNNNIEKMVKGNQSSMGLDWKVFLVFAVALNVVLISKLVQEKQDGDQGNNISQIRVDAETSRYGDAQPAYTTTSSSHTSDGVAAPDADADVAAPDADAVSVAVAVAADTESVAVTADADTESVAVAAEADTESGAAHAAEADAESGAADADTESGAAADVVIDLDHGNPTMYEEYWKHKDDKTTVVIPGWQFISYFSDMTNICWFLEPDFAKAAIRLHNLVGNAATEDRYMVVGTGSSQLYQAVLYALTASDDIPKPMSVVSAVPYYSAYPVLTDFLKSGLHKWAGDAYNFSSPEPYVEVVTSPNNPDGSTRQAVANGDKRILIHDLAYYWPQYAPITHPVDQDIMLFTISKSTGHAGTRIGWALVKDPEIAKKMTKYMEISTIGVSKDSQLRAAKILQALSDDYDSIGNGKENERFFEYSYNVMVKRWMELRAAVDKSEKFSLPTFSPDNCTFSGQSFEPQPAFAWLKCEEETVDDCASFLRSHNIKARSGETFGASPKYVRVSMTDNNYKFKILIQRLSNMNSE